MKDNNYLNALWDLFLETGDPFYLNVYSVMRQKNGKNKKNERSKM